MVFTIPDSWGTTSLEAPLAEVGWTDEARIAAAVARRMKHKYGAPGKKEEQKICGKHNKHCLGKAMLHLIKKGLKFRQYELPVRSKKERKRREEQYGFLRQMEFSM